jgi:hypothetical protein
MGASRNVVGTMYTEDAGMERLTILAQVPRAVDRRPDRARHDAERTTAAFSERLRDEVDPATVTADLDGTMAPTALGVWLRPRDGSR